MVFVGWGFGSFLFYKIATAMMFEHGLNLVTSGVIGLLAGVAILLLGAAQATTYGIRRLPQMLGTEPINLMHQQMALAIVVVSIAMAVMGWLVVQGFDAKFADQMSLGVFRDQYRSYTSNFILSMVVFLLPVAVNGAWGLGLYSKLVAAMHEPVIDPNRE